MQPVDQPFPGLSGLRVIVTGGTRGIGAGIAQGFLRSGAQVLVCARNAPASPPAADGRTASFAHADVRDPEQARRVIRTGRETVGRRAAWRHVRLTPKQTLGQGHQGAKAVRVGKR